MSRPFLFRSSRGSSPPLRFSEALQQGLAPDGGLYVPVSWPRLEVGDFAAVAGLPAVAARLLAPFVAGDALQEALARLSAETFDFPAPLVPLEGEGRLSVLELF